MDRPPALRHHNDIQLRRLKKTPCQRFRNPRQRNSNTFDWEGRQIACEHGNVGPPLRTQRQPRTGRQIRGQAAQRPERCLVHPDGGIWFTDPGYGSLMNYEGNKGELVVKEAIYRIDPKTLKMAKVNDEMFKPNGLCFSPDYKKLYVAETGSSHYPKAPKNIMVFDLVDDVRLSKGRQFASMEMNGKAGLADGIRADVDGNIWAAGGWVGAGYDGVHVFAPDGVRIGLTLLPEIGSNCCFGGAKRNRLFMAASRAVCMGRRGHIT